MEVAEANPEEWAVGFQDECWWSRVALPTLSSFSEEKKPDRMIQPSVAKDDPSEATKAISCYGLYLPRPLGDMWLRVVEFDGLLGSYELADRVCGAFGCPHHEHLSIPQEVARSCTREPNHERIPAELNPTMSCGVLGIRPVPRSTVEVHVGA